MTKNGSRITLITGGTSGIGLALAEACHARGDKVWVCARQQAALEAVEQRLPGVRGVVCDVTDQANLVSLADQIAAADGRLDLLIANVGGLSEMDFNAAPLDERLIRTEIERNLTAPVLTVNAMLPLVKESAQGQIVIVGSGFGWSPTARAPLYSAGKAGVRAFVTSLRAQLRDSGIHVMEVVPPVVDTPAVAHRSVAKIPPAEIARLTLRGLSRRAPAIFAGQTRMIPLMLRLAPRALERITLKA